MEIHSKPIFNTKGKLQCPNCRVQMSQKVIKWGLHGPYEIETFLSQQVVPINEVIIKTWIFRPRMVTNAFNSRIQEVEREENM